MSIFFIRVWVDGDKIVAVRTGEGQITDAGSYANSTYIDAIAEGAIVNAGTLLPTLSYANNQLSSSLVTLLPAKDVKSLIAPNGYEGQQVYNWADKSFYQWNGNPWNGGMTGDAVLSIAKESFTEDIADAVIDYDNFSDDVVARFDDIEATFASVLADLGTVTADTVALEADVTALELDYTTLDGTLTTTVSAVSGLETRVTAAEDTIITSASDIAALEIDFAALDLEVSGQATAISGIDARVTSTEDTLTVAVSELTSLGVSVSDLNTELGTTNTELVAQGTALSGLNTELTNTNGALGVVSSSLTELTTTVGENTVAVTEAAESINGIEGKYGVTIDNNGNITGFQLLSGQGGSAFNVRADQFSVFNGNDVGGVKPFTIFTSPRTINGVTYPAGTYIKDAFIDEASIVNLSVTSLKIKGQAVDYSKLATAAATTAAFAGSAGAVTGPTSGGFPGTGVLMAAAGISIPPGQFARVYITVNYQNGYRDIPTEWGYRLVALKRNANDNLVSVQLTKRIEMSAPIDIASVSWVDTFQNPSLTQFRSYTLFAYWYGENANITAQQVTVSLLGQWK